MQRRGRLLQSLKASVESSEPGEAPRRAADTIEPASQPEPAARPALSGRGRILSQMAALSLRSEGRQQAQPEQPGHPGQPEQPSRPQVGGGGDESPMRERNGSSNGSESSGPGRLVRQDSNASGRSSVVSQQFAAVTSRSRTALPKVPTQSGEAITLSLNFMTFNTSTDFNIEEYHVDFNPNIESIRLRYRLLRTDPLKQVIGEVMHWTGTNLYLPRKLENRVTEVQAQHPVTETPVRVRLTFVKTPPDSELMPFYNSLMHKVMNRLKYVIINRQHYSPMHKIIIEQHRLEVWPGWITAIQRLDGGIKLSVDASFRVLRLETVRDLMMDIKNRERNMNLKEAFERDLVGAIIMTRYNNKAYRIDEIDIAKNPSHTFLLTKENRQISYVDYMREHWNVEVRDANQPMIIHRPKPKRGQPEAPEEIYLIPELCVTTGLTDAMRANFHIMKAIGDHTRLPPQVRETKLTEFLQQLSTDERAKSVFSDWNLSVRPTFDVVTGRRLANETMLFGKGKTFAVGDNADWTRPATGGPVFKSVDITDWVIMYTERDSQVAEEFMSALREVARVLTITFCAPRIVKLPNDQVTTYVNYGKREVKQTDQMVVILTPGKGQREDRYSACKRLYTCELPVPCQFIRCGTIQNPGKLRSITQKIVIQILSKVGGQPWAMKLPLKNFMIVGIDVYHDTIDRNKSCVGFVASMNEFASSWWSKTFFQDSLEEISAKLNITMISALRKYHSIHGVMPVKIIIYRDGVGDGQLDAVVNVEVMQVINGTSFYLRDNYGVTESPHISYIVVQKRISAKLSLRANGRIENPKPGSFLDHTITHPEYNDFYLVSQHVNQGTVSPTKYIVLSETGTLKMEHHQKLAYKMTHMYYNWCGTIRVPAPCQYAHKLAYLTGQNIRRQASERMEDKLYYL